MPNLGTSVNPSLSDDNLTTNVSTPVAATDNVQDTSTPNKQSQPSDLSGDADWKKRYDDSSKEARRIKAEKDKLEADLKASNEREINFALKSKDRFVEYLDYANVSDQEKEKYIQWYDTQYKSDNSGKDIKESVEAKTPVTSPYRESVLSRLEEDEKARYNERLSASRNFYEAPENSSLDDATKKQINNLAYFLDNKYGFEPIKALEEAKKRIISPDMLRDEGYLQGLSDNRYIASRSNHGINGRGTSGSGQEDRLPSQDEKFLKTYFQMKGWEDNSKEAQQYKKYYVARLASRN